MSSFLRMSGCFLHIACNWRAAEDRPGGNPPRCPQVFLDLRQPLALLWPPPFLQQPAGKRPCLPDA